MKSDRIATDLKRNGFPVESNEDIIANIKQEGFSQWIVPARVSLVPHNDQPQSLFLEWGQGDIVKEIVRGKYHGAAELRTFAEDFLPRAISWGTFTWGS